MNYLDKNNIKFLVVHCSDTNENQNFDIKDIHKMHIQFGWDGVGYHKIIKKNGEIENGRPEYWKGAHVKGKNEQSLGVCLIGREKFTPKQMNSLKKTIWEWKNKYPKAKVVGHRDIQDTDKTCPNFDVKMWWKKIEKNQFKDQSSEYSILVPYLEMYEKANYNSGLVNEILFGEKCRIIKFAKKNSFVFIETSVDKYNGWIDRKYIKPLNKNDVAKNIICIPSVNVTSKPNVKSSSLMNLPFGAKVIILKKELEFSEIFLPKNSYSNAKGYIPNNSYENINKKYKDWVNFSEKFVGTPYKWGGRTGQGIDCSGLLQISIQKLLVDVPRDTGIQERYFRLNKNNLIKNHSDYKRGDILFWKGHVAICVDNKNLIHANAFHHRTEIEKIEGAINRIKKLSGKISSHIRLKNI